MEGTCFAAGMVPLNQCYSYDRIQVSGLAAFAPSASDFGSEKRMNKLAEVIHRTNEYCLNHPNFTALMLPFRDGLTILRYRK